MDKKTEEKLLALRKKLGDEKWWRIVREHNRNPIAALPALEEAVRETSRKPYLNLSEAKPSPNDKKVGSGRLSYRQGPPPQRENAPPVYREKAREPVRQKRQVEEEPDVDLKNLARGAVKMIPQVRTALGVWKGVWKLVKAAVPILLLIMGIVGFALVVVPKIWPSDPSEPIAANVAKATEEEKPAPTKEVDISQATAPVSKESVPEATAIPAVSTKLLDKISSIKETLSGKVKEGDVVKEYPLPADVKVSSKKPERDGKTLAEVTKSDLSLITNEVKGIEKEAAKVTSLWWDQITSGQFKDSLVPASVADNLIPELKLVDFTRNYIKTYGESALAKADTEVTPDPNAVAASDQPAQAVAVDDSPNDTQVPAKVAVATTTQAQNNSAPSSGGQTAKVAATAIPVAGKSFTMAGKTLSEGEAYVAVFTMLNAPESAGGKGLDAKEADKIASGILSVAGSGPISSPSIPLEEFLKKQPGAEAIKAAANTNPGAKEASGNPASTGAAKGAVVAKPSPLPMVTPVPKKVVVPTTKPRAVVTVAPKSNTYTQPQQPVKQPTTVDMRAAPIQSSQGNDTSSIDINPAPVVPVYTPIVPLIMKQGDNPTPVPGVIPKAGNTPILPMTMKGKATPTVLPNMFNGYALPWPTKPPTTSDYGYPWYWR